MYSNNFNLRGKVQKPCNSLRKERRNRREYKEKNNTKFSHSFLKPITPSYFFSAQPPPFI